MGFPVLTRSLAELITPPIWNADVVANMNLLMHLQARKTSNQSVTSSTALVSDADLQLPVGASDVYLFRFHVRYDAGSTGDFKVAFALPASGQIDAAGSGSILSSTGTFQDTSWQAITTTDASPLSFAGAGANLPRTLLIDGTYIGGGTAGTVILRWAQNTSDGTATRTLAQSTLWVIKLA